MRFSFAELTFLLRRNDKFALKKYLKNTIALAQIGMEILLFFSLKNKRLQWIAGNSFKKKPSELTNGF